MAGNKLMSGSTGGERCYVRAPLMWSDIEFWRNIVFVLASQGWQRALDEKHDLNAVDRLAVHFAVPLEASGVTVQEIHSEFEEILNYAVQYISLATLEYRVVWWHVFHAPNASEWHNALLLIELLFSLPASNGKVEQAFSQLNIIKSDKRTQLSNESLNDLVRPLKTSIQIQLLSSGGRTKFVGLIRNRESSISVGSKTIHQALILILTPSFWILGITGWILTLIHS